MLKLSGVKVSFGAVNALKGIDINVEKGEIITLIGANGAGKTTTLRTISGILKPNSGEIYFKDKKISGHNASEIVASGISHVPEGRRIFGSMTVYENLEMGAYQRKDRTEIKKDIEHVFELFERLKERKMQAAGTLSGGEQQMLAIGRALMSRPQLLLLDEPSMGLAPIIVKDIFKIIKDINGDGTTILLVEQNAKMALQIADRGYVIQNGSIEMEGKSCELLNDEKVKKAYLAG